MKSVAKRHRNPSAGVTSTYLGTSVIVAALSGALSYAVTSNKRAATVSAITGAVIGLALVGSVRHS